MPEKVEMRVMDKNEEADKDCWGENSIHISVFGEKNCSNIYQN